jgi:hypothetical protein
MRYRVTVSSCGTPVRLRRGEQVTIITANVMMYGIALKI